MFKITDEKCDSILYFLLSASQHKYCFFFRINDYNNCANSLCSDTLADKV